MQTAKTQKKYSTAMTTFNLKHDVCKEVNYDKFVMPFLSARCHVSGGEPSSECTDPTDTELLDRMAKAATSTQEVNHEEKDKAFLGLQSEINALNKQVAVKEAEIGRKDEEIRRLKEDYKKLKQSAESEKKCSRIEEANRDAASHYCYKRGSNQRFGRRKDAREA
jgi:predicted RNase H-like nuclease (RuvC/YqgF family)